MKKLTSLTSFALHLLALGSSAQEKEILPKAFYKRCLVTSITGGPGKALFTTFNNKGEKAHSDLAVAQIDPLIMEYGLTDKIGVGFSKGGENYNIDANKFYNADISDGNQLMWTRTKYITADLSYHPYTSKRIDVSLVASAGYFNVTGDCYEYNEWSYNSTPLFSYNGNGLVARGGLRGRYYFSKRFGLMALAYGFSGIAKAKYQPSSISDQKNNSGYYTLINGCGLEFGLCFRIFKQKGVKNSPSHIKNLWNDYKNKMNGVEEEIEVLEASNKPLFRLVWD